MNILVVGTGYVGLTTGVALAYLGNQVICIDVDQSKIDMLRSGQTPIYEPGLPELLALAKNNITFTTNYDEGDIENRDIVFISVGTPSLPDGSADLQYVKKAAESIGERLGEHYCVIVNKSTVPIGSGNWVSSLLKDGTKHHQRQVKESNFSVASNPEFLRQGSGVFDTLYPDRIVVGAEDSRAIDLLTNLYRPILNQDFTPPPFLPRPEELSAVPLVTCDLASAELIKYSANSFLALKISYANEIAHLASKVGADVTQIMRGIGLDTRIGSRFLQAGIGWGGSCFGKDTAALVSTAREYGLEMPIVQAARKVNYDQRIWVVDTLLKELKILKGRNIALLGFAFKPNTDDLRDAPSIDISQRLIKLGAKVKAHDPVALANARKQYSSLGVEFVDDLYETLDGVDAIILVTEWPLYKEINWKKIKPVPIIDGRNFYTASEIGVDGFKIVGVGK